MVHTDLALIKSSRGTGHVISLKTTNFSGTIFVPIMRVMMVLETLVVFNELRMADSPRRHYKHNRVIGKVWIVKFIR